MPTAAPDRPSLANLVERLVSAKIVRPSWREADLWSS
jgi:hypothetical protein